MYSKENIVDAYFIKDDRTLVNVIYTDKDSGENILETLIVDAAQFSFQKLLEIYTLDQIEENTKAYIQREKQKVATIYQGLVDQGDINIVSEESNNNYMSNEMKGQGIFEALFVNDPQEEFMSEILFSFKLAVFDHDDILESLTNDQKEKIRTSTTLMDVIKVMNA